MTIKPNEEWGSEVERPVGLRVAAGDAELARLLAEDPVAPVAVTGGDLFRTIGGRPIADRPVLRALPLDVMRVTLDAAAPVLAVSHVVVRSPWWRGGWWRGPVTVVMNAEFVGEWDVAVRGHPNDGRVECFDLDAATSARQRRAIAVRLPTGSHLPHPGISRRPGREHLLEFDRPMRVLVDGSARGTARRIEVRVEADAATLYA